MPPGADCVPPWVFAVAGLLVITAIRAISSRRSRAGSNPRGLPLPPGPKGLPFIGNALSLPQTLPWEGYHKLCKEYGDMVYLTALGQGILIIDSYHHATELLDKRAANYCDRPTAPILDLMDFDWNFSSKQYGPSWRHYRRNFHQYLNQNAVPKYHPIMHEERDDFVQKLRDTPEDFIHHLEMLYGRIIMRTSYGFDDAEQNEKLIHTADAMMRGFVEATTPGRFLFNAFPILKRAPSWFPGTSFRAFCQDYLKLSYKTIESSFEDAQRDIMNGRKSEHPSIAAALVDRLSDESLQPQERAEMEAMAKGVCAVAYIGGSETTLAAATALIIALANHPGVQKKAQAELDAIIGDRLPIISDRLDLPYVSAVVKEIGRWYNPAPLLFALAHVSREDDEYNGYFIPKGTMVVPICWTMMHDPEVWDNPNDFRPERYLKDGKIDPSVPDAERAAFGFGRRICPGRHFSDDALFLFASSLLAAFHVSPPNDEDGKPAPIPLKLKFELIAKPLPFKCNFTPRSRRDF
ncbi:cytochrome P450 98A3 [Ephemerocybe angulata]|uniref:Cytochrome P450 98A3 n=1 Tax=Ephemerocybe angulata TaxID=980116 RepID=A0A8H6HTC9_9AGAR|nr:cytochrome P450 98A3 [Tulosesus angulatus]